MEQIKELLEKEAGKNDDRSYLRLIKRLEYFHNNMKLFREFIVKESQVDPDWIAEQKADESYYELYRDKKHDYIYFTVKDKEGNDQFYRYFTIETMGGYPIIHFKQIMVDYIRPTYGFNIDPHVLAIGEYHLPVNTLIMMGYETFKCLFHYPLPRGWLGFVLKPKPNTIGVYQYEAIAGWEEMDERTTHARWLEMIKLYAPNL